MSKALYSVINPLVKLILSTPLHGLMSRNTLLLEFKGRKSGKSYTTPVSYHATNDSVHCFTDRANKWWHNLRGSAEIIGIYTTIELQERREFVWRQKLTMVNSINSFTGLLP